MKNYKTYAFDMDLTLLDTIETSNKAYKAALEKVGGVFDKDKVVYMLSTPLTTTYSEIENPTQPYEVFLNEFVEVARDTFLNGSHFYDDALNIIKDLYTKYFINVKIIMLYTRQKKLFSLNFSFFSSSSSFFTYLLFLSF